MMIAYALYYKILQDLNIAYTPVDVDMDMARRWHIYTYSYNGHVFGMHCV